MLNNVLNISKRFLFLKLVLFYGNAFSVARWNP